MKRTLPLILITIALVSVAPLISQPRDSNGKVVPPQEIQSIAPNVYLDCERRVCDLEFIKTEITFVNYVTSRQSADLHIIVTRQTTGSGGQEYTLAFYGLNRHKDKNATLRYFSKPTDTQDQIRRGFANVLKQGLIPYVYDTPLSEFISISYSQKTKFRPSPTQDKWNYWVFSLGLRGNGNFEDKTKRYSYQVNLSANRTTEASKFRFYASGNYNERRFVIDEDETYISKSNRKNASVSWIRSIDGHWSWGTTISLYSSTFDNAELFTSFGPAVEFNVFPYSLSTRRELRLQYRISFSRRNYYELTLFGKEIESLVSQNLQVILEIKEKWGSIGAELSGSTFLHDLSKNNFKAETGIYINLFKGFSFNISGEYSRVRDQLSLPAEGATTEEILLELKRLATNYNLRFELGINFRFGSIYSNVVNPRFGNF